MDYADKGMETGVKSVRNSVWKRTGSVLMRFWHLHKISDRLACCFIELAKVNAMFSFNFPLKDFQAKLLL